MASEGALLELVGRGRKDAFFTAETAARTWWGAAYERRSASVREVRLQNPEGAVRFGHWFDVELPRTLDVITDMDLRIQMPTWLPTAAVTRNKAGELLRIASPLDPLGLVYGWTNSIANYLVARWALFVDNLMIVEGFGDFNAWYPDMETTHSRAPIIHAMTGTHNGSDRSVAANATPPELNFRVPLAGMQRYNDVGLPMCALASGQRIYVRFWLRPMEKLVETGRIPSEEGFLYEQCPAPWGGRAVLDASGTDTGLLTLQEWEVGQPYVVARFSGLQLEPEVRAALTATDQEITFRQQRWESFTIEDRDWRVDGHVLKKRLEIHGFFQALFLAIISSARLAQNKYRDIWSPGGGEWLSGLTLSVNGQPRILEWPPKRFQELANNTQLPRDVWSDLYYLIFGVNPEEEPAGCCNLSRTQKVELYLRLLGQIPDPLFGNNQAVATVLGLSWNVMEIVGGRLRLKFVD
jgi:hypothetical protein